MFKLLLIGFGIYLLYRMSMTKKLENKESSQNDDEWIEDIEYEEVDE